MTDVQFERKRKARRAVATGLLVVAFILFAVMVLFLEWPTQLVAMAVLAVLCVEGFWLFWSVRRQ
jgi:hypothetical protein